MKKLLSMLLCLVLICGMLVSCDEERVYGSYLPNYEGNEPEVEEKLTLNLYIITDDETAENAKDTVALNINLYTTSEETYNTDLRVHYYPASRYFSKVSEVVADDGGSNAANIVLINSYDMFIKFLADGVKFVDLTDYLSTDEFGPLKVNIAPALLEGIVTYDPNNKEDPSKIYAIPNNRRVGEYEYLLIDKWAAKEFKAIAPSMLDNGFGPGDSDFEQFVADVEELRARIAASGKNPDDYIKTTKGCYEDQALLEADGKYECVITKYPTVNEEVAFSSAFAIIDRGENYNYRAMEIIYAINMDKELHDLLQYGVEGINYFRDTNGDIVYETKKDGKTEVINEEARYSMNLEYTGNVFTASYSASIDWTKDVAENVSKQLEMAVAELKYVAPEDSEEDSSNVGSEEGAEDTGDEAE